MGICDVIKWENMGDTFIYKFPEEDFNTMSQLIVNESQEAIFFNGGEALDTFGPGRHILKTQNLPVLTKLITLATDDNQELESEIDNKENISTQSEIVLEEQFDNEQYLDIAVATNSDIENLFGTSNNENIATISNIYVEKIFGI